VSQVHCALVLTTEGLCLVDLVGKDGIRLDGQPVHHGFLDNGAELVIGVYLMSVWRRAAVSPDIATSASASPVPPQVPSPSAHAAQLGGSNAGPAAAAHARMAHAAGATPLRRRETRHEQDSRSSATRDAASAMRPPKDPELDWLGTLFTVERHGRTLVIVPTIESGMFRSTKLRTELDALHRKFDDFGIRRVVIDLQALQYAGAEAFGVVVALARKAEESGGWAVLCGARPHVQEALTNMGLNRLWPIYPTRDKALAAVDKLS